MKNVHLIPTDKPNRLYYNKNGRITFSLCKTEKENTPLKPCYNIYITSDEEIKVGDWVYCLREGLEPILKQKVNTIGVNNDEMMKKIILTTDQSLDGVQAIDDDFLEWFVKNPSCKEVEVKRNKKLSKKSIWDAKEGDLVFNNHNCGGVIEQLSDDIRVHIVSENGEGYMETAITSDNGIDTLVINNYKVYEYSDYKIIIPKEEQKQHLIDIMQDDEELGLYDETLEEAAEKYDKKYIEYVYDAFIEGAKWQAEQLFKDDVIKTLETGIALLLKKIERMYSEEEVLKIVWESRKFFHEYKNTPFNKVRQVFYEWFEQFKKK